MKLLNLFILIILGFLSLSSFLGLSLVESFILATTLLLLVQGGFASFAMLYSFLKPKNLHRVLPPRVVYGGGFNKYSLIFLATANTIMLLFIKQNSNHAAQH